MPSLAGKQLEATPVNNRNLKNKKQSCRLQKRFSSTPAHWSCKWKKASWWWWINIAERVWDWLTVSSKISSVPETWNHWRRGQHCSTSSLNNSLHWQDWIVAGPAASWYSQHPERVSTWFMCYGYCILKTWMIQGIITEANRKEILENRYLHTLFSVYQYFVTCEPCLQCF